MNCKVFNILIIISLLLFSCTKDKDDQSPTITVTAPTNNQQINGIDTIQVLATIHDDRMIETVRISLRDNNDIPVLSTIVKKPNTKDYDLHTSYFMDDIHLASGSYYFDISASDGENTAHVFVNVFLNEVPKARQGIFVFSNTGSNSDIYLLDNNYNGSYYTSFNGDYLGCGVNSYDQRLIHSSGITGSISAKDLKTGSTVWSIPISNSPPTPYYTGFLYYNQNIFMGIYSGSVQGYDNNGAANYYAVANSGYYVETAHVHNDNYLVTEQQSISTSAVKLVLYWMASGAEVQQVAINEDIKGIFSTTSDQIVLFTNDVSSMGKLIFYDIPSGLSSSPFSIGVGKIDDCVEITSGVYLVANGGDITLINANNFSTLPYLTSIGATKLKYDELTNELFVVNGNTLSIYNYTSKTLKGSYTNSSNILDLDFWYNK